jgi:hypothetical protein
MERELYHVLTIFKYKFLALSEGIILEVIKKYHNESRVSDRIYIRCLYNILHDEFYIILYIVLTIAELDCCQKPSIDKGQTVQGPKEKGQRDKQRSTKHYTNPTKTGLDMYEYICITERL